MTQYWNKERNYSEAERVTYKGERWEARFELIRGIRPDEPLGHKFWKRVPVVQPKVPAYSATQRAAPPSYVRKVITAD